MQLAKKRSARISGVLGAITTNLFLASGVLAQASTSASPVGAGAESGASSAVDELASDIDLIRADAAVLFYQESGGRVRAIEPVIGATYNDETGNAFSLKLTTDILTGATPNGAAPWNQLQTFITPAHAPGHLASVTSSSGGSTLVTIPGTGLIARQYTTAAHALPVDPGFRDQRYAAEAGYAFLLGPDTHMSVGGGGSTERDYTSFSLNSGFSRDFNQKNTTVSAAVNVEFDDSRPFFGTPTPLTVMSADQKGSSKSKMVYDLVTGVTQVVNRYWLTQLNYSIGSTDGYQTDPYRIISVVDPLTGGPVEYLYENRPKSRLRQSVFWGNKVALGPTVLDLSARGYRDSWGINSATVDVSERVPITSWLYVEPEARYYRQNAAKFFHDYLLSGQPMPTYASSDSRLDAFSATTFGVRLGVKTSSTGEFYVQGESYQQQGRSHQAGAVGDLAHENLFSGIKAFSVIAGYTVAFNWSDLTEELGNY